MRVRTNLLLPNRRPKKFERGFAIKSPQQGSNLMKTCYAVTLAALAGVGIGGLAVQGIHAQAKPPAYHIVEIDVTNEDLYNKEWVPKADATVRAAGGVYLVRGTNIERIEGAAPKRLLITKWDNIDKLTAWRESEAYMKTLPILDKAVKSVRSYAVEGVN
jgi:uncharacterized protein (DUF1330 family)